MITKILLLLFLLLSAHGTFAAQGIVTLTTQGPSTTNEIQIATGQTFKILSGYDNCSDAELQVDKDGKTFHIQPAASAVVMAGPAVVRLINNQLAGPTCLAYTTLDIEPAAFPPDKTAVVGAFAGNVQVIMEISTDLVNWTTATNSLVYTNAPDARFFRIKMITNATP